MSFVTGNVKHTLRVEGLLLFFISILIFHYSSPHWDLFLFMFFIPDLSILGYLISSRIGSILYNLSHSTIGPCGTLLVALLTDHTQYLPYCVIWFAHIGFDRSLGYGLKYASSFYDTHLGQIGSKFKRFRSQSI